MLSTLPVPQHFHNCIFILFYYVDFILSPSFISKPAYFLLLVRRLLAYNFYFFFLLCLHITIFNINLNLQYILVFILSSYPVSTLVCSLSQIFLKIIFSCHVTSLFIIYYLYILDLIEKRDVLLHPILFSRGNHFQRNAFIFLFLNATA